jgi:hypothetical protein
VTEMRHDRRETWQKRDMTEERHDRRETWQKRDMTEERHDRRETWQNLSEPDINDKLIFRTLPVLPLIFIQIY